MVSKLNMLPSERLRSAVQGYQAAQTSRLANAGDMQKSEAVSLLLKSLPYLGRKIHWARWGPIVGIGAILYDPQRLTCPTFMKGFS